jgi:hypothetical protein
MFEYESNTDNNDELTIEESAAYNDVVVDWESPEHKTTKKSQMWYASLLLAGIVVIVIIVAIAIVAKSFNLVAISEIIAVIATVISIIMISNKKLPTARYSLNQHTLTVNNKTFSLDSFKSFSLDSSGETDEITLISNKDYIPALNLRLEDNTKQQVFDILSEGIPYKQSKNGFIDRISSKLNL